MTKADIKAGIYELREARRGWFSTSHADRVNAIEEAERLLEECGAEIYGADWYAEEEPSP